MPRFTVELDVQARGGGIRSFVQQFKTAIGDITAAAQQAASKGTSLAGLSRSVREVQTQFAGAVSQQVSAGNLDPGQAFRIFRQLDDALEPFLRTLAEINPALRSTLTSHIGREQLAGVVPRQAAAGAVGLSPEEQVAARRHARIEAQKVAFAELGLHELEGETLELREARAAIARRAQTERQRLLEIRAAMSQEEGESRLIVERKVAERRLNQAINARVQAEINRRAAAGEEGFTGTTAQKLQQYIATRQGGSPRLASEFLTGPQLLASRALTTASFALSGFALYGTISGIRQIINEATELERQLASVRGQFESTFGSQATELFREFRSEITSIARETGASAAEVAFVSRQLVGVFRVPEGLPNAGQPDPQRAAREARTAFRFAQVTGLDPKEINDSMTAIAVAFGENFEKIADDSIQLENRLGVLASETIKFTADLAPLAESLGFTQTQLSALGAVAQQVSGRTGGALAEQLGRVFAEIQAKRADILALYASTPALADAAPKIAKSFGEGDIQEVFSRLLADYEKLTNTQRVDLIEKLGGARQAAAVVALLERGQVALTEMRRAGEESVGSLDRRWENFRDTVSVTFARLQQAVEQFGLALFDAGVSDLLKDIGSTATVVVAAASQMLRVFSEINQLFGGLPGRFIAAAVAIRGMAAAWSLLQKAGILGGLTGLLRGGGAAGGRGGIAGLLGGLVAPTATLALGTRTLGGQGGLNRFLGIGTIGSGGLAGGLAAGLTRIGPIAALIAGSEAYNKYQGLRSQYNEMGDALAEQAARTDTERLKQVIEAREEGFQGLVENLTFGIGGSKRPEDILKDVLQIRLAPTKVEQLRAGHQADLGSDRDTLEQSNQSLDELIRDLERNKDDDEVNRRVDEQLARYVEIYPELQSLFDTLDTKGEQRLAAVNTAKDAVEQLETNQPRVTSQNALVDLQQGRGTFAAFDEAISAEIALWEAAAAGARAAGDSDAEFITQIDELNRTRSQALLAYLQRQGSLRELFASATGGDANAVRAANALTILRDTRITDPEAQASALSDLIEAEEAAFKREFDNATSAAEMLQLIQTGRELDPVARAAALRLQLRSSDENRAFLQQAATVLGGTVETLSEAIISQIITYGTGAGEIAEAMLRARRNELAASTSRLDKEIGKHPGRNALLREEQRQVEGQIANVDALLGKDGLDDVTDPSKITGDADAVKQYLEAYFAESRRQEEALLAIERAQAQGDPEKLAEIAKRDAAIQQRYARTQAEKDQARAAAIEAQNQADEAANQIASARLDLEAAQAEGDPVAEARIAQRQADLAARTAKGRADALSAQAARVRADRQLAEAIFDVYQSQLDLARAIAEAAGDTVGAAVIAARHATNELNDLLTRPHSEAEENRLRGSVATANAAARDARLNESLRQIDVALELEQITIGQAIVQLEALLRLPGITKEQTDNLLIKIKQLRGEVSKDLQFDIPSEIRLPTLYEARRLVQSEQTGMRYQDSRIIQVNMTNNNATDYQGSIDRFVDLLNGAPRFGTAPRTYP